MRSSKSSSEMTFDHKGVLDGDIEGKLKTSMRLTLAPNFLKLSWRRRVSAGTRLIHALS